MRQSLLNHQLEPRSCEMQKTRQLNTVTKILLALFAILSIPQEIWAEDYPLIIGNTQVTSDNANNVFNNGTVSFTFNESNASGTLTLNNATITGGIEWRGFNLTIKLNGENSITNTSGDAIKVNVPGVAGPSLSIVKGALDAKCRLILTSSAELNGNYALIYQPIRGFSNINTDIEYLQNKVNTGTEIFTSYLFGGGDGTSSKPYLIQTPQDLMDLATYVNRGVFDTYGLFFKLEENLNFINLDYEPIGYRIYSEKRSLSLNTSFEGTFDGNNYTISNLTYSTNVIGSINGNPEGICLFSYFSGTLKNLTLDHCKLGGGYNNGAITDFLYGTIDNCTISSCTIEGDGQNGGIAGYLDGLSAPTIIKDCSVVNCTIQNGDAMGGIAYFTTMGVTIQNCTVDGGSITTNKDASIGGIVNSSDGTVTNCTVKGISISGGSNSQIGAITPTSYSGTLTGNYYYGDVTVNTGGTILSGHTQRGTGYYDNQQNYAHKDVDGAKLYTKQLSFQSDNHCSLAEVAGKYYEKIGTGVISVAPGLTTELTVTPIGDYAPMTGTVTDATGKPLQTITPTKASGSYTYSFTMPDADATFNVTSAINLESNSFSYQITPLEYTGSAIILPSTISMTGPTTGVGITLTQGTDYTIEGYKDRNKVALNSAPVNVDLYYVTIKGKSNYTGTVDVAFSVSRADLSNVTISAIPDQTYTGNYIEPTFTVTFNGKTVNADEYVVAYTNNKDVSTANTKATVTLTSNVRNFMPNTSKTTTFNIVKASATISFATPSVSKTFGDAAFTNALTNTGDGTVTYASNNTAVATVNATTGLVTIVGNGTATITATVADGTNYTYATKTASYTLNVGAATMSITAAGYTGTYDGKAHGITVTAPTGATVKYGTAAGTYNLNASPTYTNAGTYTVYYQVTKANYSDVTGSQTIAIAKAAAAISFATASVNKTYGDATFTNTLTNTGDGTVTYASNNTAVATVNTTTGAVTIVGNGTATITATVADGTNYTYATKTASYTLTVGTAAMNVTAAGYTGTFDGKAHGITVTAPAGATVKYGTTAGTYNLDASPTYTNAGNYTVYYQVTKAGYTAVTGSQTVAIAKAAAAISYATTSIDKLDNEAAFTNDLTKTGDGTVTYTSSDTNVATINETTGEVTIVGVGTTTITATVADGTNYTYATKTATYTLTVTASIKKFDLWIGDTQVTEANQDNVLGNAGDPTFQYFPDLNKLFITNNTTAVKIESKMTAGLTIYLAPNSESKVTQITSTAAAPLTITTDGNNPGRLSLKTASGNVIEGFSDLTLEENLCILDADDVYYKSKALATRLATIGIVIEPILEEKVESFENSNWYQNPDGTENTLENFVYDDKVLITLKNTHNPDGDGADDSGIVLNNEMMDYLVDYLNLEENAPGTLSFATIFTGLTILVPAGEGWIVIDGETHNGYRLKLRSLFENDLEEEMTSERRTSRAFFYTFDEPTFVGIYNGGTNAAARQKVLRPGRKTTTNIKVFNVTVSPKTVKASNPASAASGGQYQGTVPAVGQDMENPTEIESGIKDINYNIVKSSDRWFNLNGQQIDEPTKKGLYIHDGQLRIKK